MPLDGWLKLHRIMQEHPVWRLTDGQFRVWITCLLMANFTEKPWDLKTKVVLIPAGSFSTSLDHLARRSRTSKKTVRGALTALIRLGSIRTQIRAQRYTIIEIVNWPTYNSECIIEGTVQGTTGAQLGHDRGTDLRREEGKKGRSKNKTLALVVDKSTPWADTLDAVRTFLVGIQAPDAFYNETYWLRIDQWLDDKNSQVFYFEELKGYLAWCVSQNGHRAHKDQLRGFRNWLSTTKRWKERDAQRKAITGGKKYELPWL